MFYNFFSVDPNENTHPVANSSNISSGVVSASTPSGMHISPESTIHSKVTHQGSVDSL